MVMGMKRNRLPTLMPMLTQTSAIPVMVVTSAGSSHAMETVFRTCQQAKSAMVLATLGHIAMNSDLTVATVNVREIMAA